ncbi:MAG TPA: PLP-dependent aminotransferase family protein [Chloroflexia bacterium]|nr:PLP-dependent aminotransferase family protein [Chloroflexia bacterium]
MNWENLQSDTARAARASDIRELLKLTARPDMISFAGGLPDPALFPVAEYEAAMQRVMENNGAQALQYSTTEGLTELRQELVRRLADEQINCAGGIDEIILTTGSQQALDLLALLLINPGDTILVEAPSYLGALQAFNLRQPHYESVEMDGEGLRIDLLEAKLAELKREGRQPKFLYTVPTFQNPAGVTLTLERRRALLELARRENFLIIEDDPYGRLRFRGEALPSLKSLDTDGRVITLRTFSKTLAPGLRTGYIIGDPEILRRVVILKQAADLCSPALTHYIILEMLKSGAMERYIERVVEVYREKEEVMATELEARLGGSPVRWNEPDGGMFFWLTLPHDIDCNALLLQSLEAGVAYVRGAAFYTDGISGLNCMRLNFSQPSPEKIKLGIERLATIIQASLLAKRA